MSIHQETTPSIEALLKQIDSLKECAVEMETQLSRLGKEYVRQALEIDALRRENARLRSERT